MASISRNSKIQVLYAASGVTPDNGDLYNGELAYSYGQKELYIGGGNSTDVTFVGAEILRSGDDPFGVNIADNNLATTQAIYNYVDGQIGSAAGVTTVEGVTGAVNLQSANDFLTISATTHPNKSITFDIDTDDVTIGLTGSKLGLLSNSVGSVHIQNDAVALGTKTTGNYVESIVASDGIDLAAVGAAADGKNWSISLKNSSTLTDTGVVFWDNGNSQLASAPMTTDGTNMTVTDDLNVGGTLDVAGNLIVRGNLTTLDVVNVKIEDPMIVLGATSGSPTNFDIGFVGKHGGGTYTGLLRDADDGVFYLFDTSDDLETATSFIPGNAIVSELRAHIVAGTFS